uniref:Uncharacterized protein n=1 Tax=Pelusios castaneus TaxID=367368 RepID=A0A8C8RJS8_9SAUR
MKGDHGHKKMTIRTSPTFPRSAKGTVCVRPVLYNPNIFLPGSGRLAHYAVIKFPLTTESALKKMEDNTQVFVVDVEANKQQVTQADGEGVEVTWGMRDGTVDVAAGGGEPGAERPWSSSAGSAPGGCLLGHPSASPSFHCSLCAPACTAAAIV